MNERFEEIEAKAKKIDQLVRSGEREKETFQKQQCVDNCRTILSEMDRALSELERENMNESQDTRFEKKLTSLRKDYEIAKKKVNLFDEKVTRDVNKNKLMAGELHGVQRQKAERDMITDLHKETDIQGDIIMGIKTDVIDANRNLQNVGVELNQQGEVIQRIKEGVDDATGSVKKSDKIINEMNRRNYCIKFLMHLVIVLLALGILILGGFYLYRKYFKKS